MPPSIVLISGSTRDGSTNTAALRAATLVDPAIATCTLDETLSRLPQFNPDEEEHHLPGIVADLRRRLVESDAVLFCTPEYAGAMPGALKNLLEWTIGGSALYNKPVGWINVSSRPDGARNTYDALRIVLEYAGATIIEDAIARIPVTREIVDSAGALTDAATIARIHDVVRALAGSAPNPPIHPRS